MHNKAFTKFGHVFVALVARWVKAFETTALVLVTVLVIEFGFPQLTVADTADVVSPLQAAETVGDLPGHPSGILAATPQEALAVRARHTITITAYSSTPDQTDSTPFITASGAHVRRGVVAANFVPFGTKVRIPELFGDEIFEVQDRMNKRYPNRLDVWMGTRSEALVFGVRHATVEILDDRDTSVAVADIATN